MRCQTLFLGAALALSLSAPAFADLTPTRLLCEYKINPLAVDSPSPRLFWQVTSTDRGARQSAYRILVASTAENLAKNNGDLWDSGQLTSDETLHRVYGGKPLAAGQQAFWKVQVWDSKGKTRWSKPAHWTQGIAARDWSAQWIQPSSAQPKTSAVSLDDASWIWLASDPETPPAGRRYFRLRFDAPTGAISRLALAADNSYTVAINNRPFPEARGSEWKTYQTYDLGAAIRPGANTLTVQVTNEGDSPNPAGLIGKLVVNGQSYPTGTSWEGSTNGRDWSPIRVLGPNGMAPWGRTESGGSTAMTPPPHFRKRFSLAKPVRRALLYATALGVYELGLNGKAVSDDVLSPGWTDYAKRVHYLAYDLTRQLKAGPNELSAQLGDGWYASYLAFTGRRHYYGGDPKLRVQLNVEYTDGTHESIGTDGSWEWARGAIQVSDMLMGCTIDTRVTPTEWQPVQVADAPKIAVEAHPGNPIRPLAQVVAVRRGSPKPGTFVYDLGQNLTGWARITVTGKPGQVVTIRHAERLNADGTAYFTNLRAAKATDIYTLKGGKQVLEPKFTFHGFQYVEITGIDTAPAAKDVVGIAVHSEMDRTLQFSSDNPLLNKLTENIDWGFRGNALDVPTDCPQRDERAGWTGDAQVFAKTAMLNRAAAPFFTKWLVDLIEDGQGPDGALPDVAPYLNMVGRGNAAWEDAGVVVTYRMWEMYGDTQAIRDHWAALTRYMEHLARVAPSGLRGVGAYGDWLLLDQPQRSTLHGTAYYFYCAQLMAKMATATGKSDEAAHYTALAQKIRVIFNQTFVTDDGQVSDRGQSSQTFYALALGWNLIDDSKRSLARGHMERLLASRRNHLATGFIGTPVLLFALDGVGRADLANQLMLNDDFPSWLYQVKLGSTTMWERWDGWTPEKGFQDPGMNSFNHYWLGCVGEWMTTGLVGIDTDGPGWKRILVQPRIAAGLNTASATYDSIRGKVSASWKKNTDGTITITATLPANTSGKILLPDGRSEALEAGTTTFTVK